MRAPQASMPTEQGSTVAIRAISSARDHDSCMAFLPFASTACRLGVLFARSIPKVVTFKAGALSRLGRLAPSDRALAMPTQVEEIHNIR